MKSQRLNGGGIGNLPWYSILSHKQYQTNRSSFLSEKEALIEVIHLWTELKEATWTILILGLKNAGQVALAKKLASKYGTCQKDTCLFDFHLTI